MALSNIWTASNNGTTQTCAAWNMRNVKRQRQSQATGTLAFDIDGANVDSALPFAIWSTLSLYRNGVCWWSGPVTKTPRKGEPKAEALSFEVSDPWWYLENVRFQQQYVTLNPDGSAGETMTTTRTRVILGQGGILPGANPPIIKMDLGQVMLEALYYALYALQGVAYPTTVDASGLPAAPPLTGTPNPPPFLIGTIMPSLTVPYCEVKDKSCSDILKMLLRYVPDAVTWFDFTTTNNGLPCPTLNIGQRPLLLSKTIAALGGTVVGGFSPTPRYGLQVPVVVAKYEQTDTVDGVSYDLLTVDSYPPAPEGYDPDAWLTQKRALVQTIDLVGGNATFQKQTIVATARPLTGAESSAMQWVLNHHPSLVQGYDTANMSIATGGLTTKVNPSSPYLAAPYNMPSSGTGYNFELLDGVPTPWMWDNGGYLAAEATLLFKLNYAGSDPSTLVYFASQPVPGVLVVPVTIKITNAQSQTYQQLVSVQEPEDPPLGNAEIIYNILAQLHQEGDVILVEQECSDLLPIGCTFNTSDGLAEWQNMNALVLRVTEVLDTGTTTVEFGPPTYLSLQTLEEIYRANQTLFSWKLNQRVTGKAGSSNTTQGPSQAAHTAVHLPPALPQNQPGYPVLHQTAPGVYAASITPLKLFTDSSQKTAFPISGSGSPLPVLATDYVYIEGTLNSDGTIATAQWNSYGNGGTWVPTTDIQIGSTASWLNYQYGTSGVYPDVQQIGFRVLVAAITPGAAGALPVVAPRVNSNLAMTASTAWDASARAFSAFYPSSL